MVNRVNVHPLCEGSAVLYVELVCYRPLLLSRLICATAWAGLLLRERHYGSKGGLSEQREIMSFSSGLNSLITSHPLTYHPPSILLSLTLSPVPFLHLWAWHYPYSSWEPKLVTSRASAKLLCFWFFNFLRPNFPAYQHLIYDIMCDKNKMFSVILNNCVSFALVEPSVEAECYCFFFLSSHSVWDGDLVCGILSAGSPLCSTEQRHRDPSWCQKVCHGTEKTDCCKSKRHWSVFTRRFPVHSIFVCLAMMHNVNMFDLYT